MLNALNKVKVKFLFLKDKVNLKYRSDKKYITSLDDKVLKALSELKVYKDIGFKEITNYTIKKDTIFSASEIVFTKVGTPRFKLSNGYITTNKKFVELTSEPVTKRKLVIEGKEHQVRYDIEHYITSLEDKAVKALTDLKIYKDLDFKVVTDRVIGKSDVFKVIKIEVTKGGTPRFKLSNGYVTTNKKFVELTSEPVTKRKLVIEGKEHQVRYDIEHYITSLEDKAVKALTDLKIYKDLDFKVVTDRVIGKSDVFKVIKIEVTKGGTPRFKLSNGYITTNKKFVELTSEPVTKRKLVIEGKEHQVRYDIEHYITSLEDKAVKALTDLKIYKDLDFKVVTDRVIGKSDVFKVIKIEVTKGGTPRFKLSNGYVTTNKKFVELTSEPVTKRKLVIEGKEHQVRYDIEHYITSLEDKAVKALTDLKIYKDLDFKVVTDRVIGKSDVFKVIKIEVTKGGTPRFKLSNGYITTNKKFVELTSEPVTKRKLVIEGKEHQVRYDIEHYITSLEDKAVKALTDLKIYKDLDFKVVTDRVIGKDEIFRVAKIEINHDGTPCFKVATGYVVTNKNDVELTLDLPLVSIVVPIYNVEKYLKECLVSLQKQTYQNLEIILINDGSPDNSIEIAEKFKALDSRFIVHTQVNAGLSAARNKGIELAKGQYLWFVDSDDIIPENAVKVMVQNLLKSGSDFAVGCYRRFNSIGFKKPAHWISDLHENNIINTTLQESSDVLVNAIACSKVINYKYLIKNNLFFEIGILYEDQLWSAKLFSYSTSFDIIKDVIYEWRVREDNSSITQQSQDVNNLASILNAVQTAVDEFYRLGLDDIAHERIIQFLSNNMREYISYLDKTNEDYFNKLSEGIINLTKDFPLEKWKNVPAHIASIEWLLIKKYYERVIESISLGVRNIFTMVATYRNDLLLLKVPYWNDPEVNFPNEVLCIKENQFKPNVELRKAEWIDTEKLRIEGWAYLSLVDPEEVLNPAKLLLVSQDGQHSIEVKMNNFDHPQLDRISPHQINSYRLFGFYAIIDMNDLSLKGFNEYKFQFTLQVGNISRTIDLTKLASWASAGNLKPITTDSGMSVRLFKDKSSLVLLSVKKKDVYLNNYSISNNYLNVALESEEVLSSLEFRLLDEEKKEYSRFKVSVFKSNKNYYNFKINIEELLSLESSHWLVRVNDINNKSYVIDTNNIIDMPITMKKNNSNKLSIYSTEYGNVGLINSQLQLLVDSIENSKNGIKISGCLIGGNFDQLNAKICDHRYNIDCKINKVRGGRFSLLIPYLFKNWDTINYLASGKYKLEIFSGISPVLIVLDSPISSQLPIWMSKEPPLVCRLEYELKKKNLILTVDPTISLEMQGVRNRNLNILNHINSNSEIDEKAVFFRTYYGESTTCCALGIHNELRKRKSDLKLYWSVKDSSISIPEGGIAVIEGSKEWFDLYSSAKYIITNTHQPDFFHKKDGQIVVVTFHGYPFKLAGLPFWQSSGVSKIQIKSFIDRHNQWDYLVSPAPYATPILNEVFPSKTAKTIEIGYPRNDVFFSKDNNITRSNIRKKLGISSNQKAILYAPTFRDNLAVNDFHAEMVKYLELNRLIDQLDDDFVILVRGHAFNARSKDRVEINSNRIIDVTDYPEITDLCLASDIGILDYSSLRFDYTLTNNPMIFFVPDLNEYIYDIRGSLVPYEETAPGPLVKTQEELVYWLSNLDLLNQKFKEAKNIFIEKYIPLEDGKASSRFVDIVF